MAVEPGLILKLPQLRYSNGNKSKLTFLIFLIKKDIAGVFSSLELTKERPEGRSGRRGFRTRG